MAYDNPDHIKTIRINVSLNKDESAIVRAVCEFQRAQKTPLIKEIGMAGVMRIAHDLNLLTPDGRLRRAYQA
jgi:hypothetical protein